MTLQTCQISDVVTHGLVYIEDWKGNVITNNITTYPLELTVEIIDVIDGIPTTFHSAQIITLEQAPTESIRQAVVTAIQAIPEFSDITA
jgi:hypothetical protein